MYGPQDPNAHPFLAAISIPANLQLQFPQPQDATHTVMRGVHAANSYDSNAAAAVGACGRLQPDPMIFRPSTVDTHTEEGNHMSPHFCINGKKRSIAIAQLDPPIPAEEAAKEEAKRRVVMPKKESNNSKVPGRGRDAQRVHATRSSDQGGVCVGDGIGIGIAVSDGKGSGEGDEDWAFCGLQPHCHAAVDVPELEADLYTSSVDGVYFHQNQREWRAKYNQDGHRRMKTFSARKFGFQAAKDLAEAFAHEHRVPTRTKPPRAATVAPRKQPPPHAPHRRSESVKSVKVSARSVPPREREARLREAKGFLADWGVDPHVCDARLASGLFRRRVGVGNIGQSFGEKTLLRFDTELTFLDDLEDVVRASEEQQLHPATTEPLWDEEPASHNGVSPSSEEHGHDDGVSSTKISTKTHQTSLPMAPEPSKPQIVSSSPFAPPQDFFGLPHTNYRQQHHQQQRQEQQEQKGRVGKSKGKGKGKKRATQKKSKKGGGADEDVHMEDVGTHTSVLPPPLPPLLALPERREETGARKPNDTAVGLNPPLSVSLSLGMADPFAAFASAALCQEPPKHHHHHQQDTSVAPHQPLVQMQMVSSSSSHSGMPHVYAHQYHPYHPAPPLSMSPADPFAALSPYFIVPKTR
ncbi:unnamed protein product [Vitrella brassicaformis CCMP3155]|uniref:AP2/ERF domain-containing protein n=2 Tax=Vitrella brassicaformis TaxID=1169539 RepID=A0A0G4FD49_VITBC|nr:unnamed protein product [Vitrella brassicaformis CCMP3155]|eukprot:CEM10779.1 unnamed protein product [Vitrella brassicaformis CCMP3155]